MASAHMSRVLTASGYAAAIIVSVTYVDRPVAEFTSLHLLGSPLFAIAAGILRSLRFVPLLAVVLLVCCGVWVAAHRRLAAWLRLPLLCSAAALPALLTAVSLKFMIGRSQVVPLYLSSHLYVLHPFHGGADYMAFPSATMAVAASIVTVLWTQRGPLRVPGALLLLVLASCLIVTSGHWAADIIGGIWLGFHVGRWTLSARRLAAGTH